MTLPHLWFLLIAVLFTGFFVLEGFDFGVGALHRVVGRTEEERRVAINTIGPFWDLFTGYGVWTGLTLLLLCLLHGTTFLSLRTLGAVRARSRTIGRWIGAATLVAVVVWGVWTAGLGRSGIGAKLALALVPLAVIAAVWALVREGDGSAFVATTLAIVGTVGSLFASLYPDVLVSSTSSSNSLTVAGSASGHYALQVMTVVACIMLPLVLLYQAWTYVVFRHRIGGAVPVPGQRSTQSAG